MDRHRGGLHRVHEGTLDLHAGGSATRMEDAGHAVTALPGQQVLTLLVHIEHGAKRNQFLHPPGSLVNQHPHGRGVAQPATGRQGVGQVQVEFFGIPRQRRRHTALGPAGGGLFQLAFGEHAHRQPRLGASYRSRQAGHAGAQHQKIEFVHVWSPRSWGGRAATLSSNRGMPNCAAARRRTGTAIVSIGRIVAGSTTSA